jgi:rhodanese-related sulfurtransferase
VRSCRTTWVSARCSDAGGGVQRNGASAKTVLTNEGALRIEVPRDRDGSFAPLLIPKHERRFTGFDDKIVAMCACGMTVREVQGFLADQYYVDVYRRVHQHSHRCGDGRIPYLSLAIAGVLVVVIAAWQSRPWSRCTRWCSSPRCE